MLQNYKDNFARFNSKYVSRGMYIMLIFYIIILNAYFVHKKQRDNVHSLNVLRKK